MSVEQRNESPRLSGSSGTDEANPVIQETTKFRPPTRLYIAFVALAFIALTVALDGTSLSVALPVSHSTKA